MKEVWKDIPNYEGYYQASSLGRIRSLDRISNGMTFKGRIRRFSSSNKYYRITIMDGKTRKTFMVHRLIALTFIPLVKGKPLVNHKDNNKRNNRADNLEWCTSKENTQHAIAIGVHPLGLPNNYLSISVIQLSKEGKFIKQFPSQQEASRELGIFQGSIGNCLRGKAKTGGGFRWVKA